MNITGAVAGNPRFQHIKTVKKTVSNPPFQITIVRSYRVTIVMGLFSEKALFNELVQPTHRRKGSRADSDKQIPVL